MLGWVVTFLIVALIAAILGFGGIAGVAIEAAKLVFFVAIPRFIDFPKNRLPRDDFWIRDGA